ncbi:MAG: hypothetical protein AAGC92_16030 [Pseudomonadota bacterium]
MPRILQLFVVLLLAACAAPERSPQTAPHSARQPTPQETPSLGLWPSVPVDDTLPAGLASAGLPPSEDVPPERLPPEVEARLDEGLAMHRADRAAWLGARLLPPDLLPTELPARGTVSEGRLQEWITLPRPGSVLVRFTGAEGKVLFDVDVPDDAMPTRVTPYDPPADLSPDQTAMQNAVRLVLAQPGLRCGAGLNSIVLPGRDGWIVWLISTSGTPGEVIMGGHHRFVVSRDGQRVLDHQPVTRGCVIFPADRVLQRTEGNALFVTHITEALPSAFHVMRSIRLADEAIVVTTELGIWLVLQGRIWPARAFQAG